MSHLRRADSRVAHRRAPAHPPRTSGALGVLGLALLLPACGDVRDDPSGTVGNALAGKLSLHHFDSADLRISKTSYVLETEGGRQYELLFDGVSAASDQLD